MDLEAVHRRGQGRQFPQAIRVPLASHRSA
jgi:hypothetical protein